MGSLDNDDETRVLVGVGVVVSLGALLLTRLILVPLLWSSSSSKIPSRSGKASVWEESVDTTTSDTTRREDVSPRSPDPEPSNPNDVNHNDKNILTILGVWVHAAVRSLLGPVLYGKLLSTSDLLLHQRHPLVLIFFLLLLTTCITIFYVYGQPKLFLMMNRHPNDLIWSFHSFVLLPISIACTYASFYLACTRNPGRITPLSHARIMGRYPFDHILYHPDTLCTTCGLEKPARSKHCRVCGVCISRMDHHCVWINGCVGEGNYAWFLAFLAWITWLCVYGAYVIAHIFGEEIEHTQLRTYSVFNRITQERRPITEWQVWRHATQRTPLLGAVGLFIACSSLITGAFLSYHGWLVWTGMTTNESFKWDGLRQFYVTPLHGSKGTGGRVVLALETEEEVEGMREAQRRVLTEGLPLCPRDDKSKRKSKKSDIKTSLTFDTWEDIPNVYDAGLTGLGDSGGGGGGGNVTSEQVLQVLGLFYTTTTTTTTTSANESAASSRQALDSWLSTFQKTTQAWSICDALVRDDLLPIQARLFSANTLKQKIQYDWYDLPQHAIPALRDSLMSSLTNPSLPTPIRTQLLVALSDCIAQMTEWSDPIADVFSVWGENAVLVPTLLRLIATLPEELFENDKLSLEREQRVDRANAILRAKSDFVFQHLHNYLSVFPNNQDVKVSVLTSVLNWLKSGDLAVSQLQQYPALLELVFRSILVPIDELNDTLFDVSIDVLIEVVICTTPKSHSTSLHPMFMLIFPYLPQILALLQTAMAVEEEGGLEQVRGIIRLFAEIGERFTPIFISKDYIHLSPVLEGLTLVTSYSNLEVVKISFNTWWYMSDELSVSNAPQAISAFTPYFERVLETLIQQLRYPLDMSGWSSAEQDEFKEFRYQIGDVLKDCVRVIGVERAISKPFGILSSLFKPADNDGRPMISTETPWQLVEAPLFAFRSMCREVPLQESTILPQLWSMLPCLPTHPKIKYAAILVIGRYAEWTNQHPEYIDHQLGLVSSGFPTDDSGTTAALNGDTNICGASAQALLDFCKHCSKYMIKHLPTLHPFYVSVLPRLSITDRQHVSEAMAHIVAAMPTADILAAMKTFLMPMATAVNGLLVTSPPPSGGSADISPKILDFLDQALAFIRVVRPPIPLAEAHPCALLFMEMYPLYKTILAHFKQHDVVTEVICNLLSKCVDIYAYHMAPVVPALLQDCVDAFKSSSHASGALWVLSRCVRAYGSEDKAEGQLLLAMLVDVTVFVKGSSFPLDQEVVFDYFNLVQNFTDLCPTLFVASTLPANTFWIVMQSLSTQRTMRGVDATLSYIIEWLSFCSPKSCSLPRAVLTAMETLLHTNMSALTSTLLQGLIHTYPRTADITAQCAQVMALLWEAESTLWVGALTASLSAYSETEMSSVLKESFISKCQSILRANVTQQEVWRRLEHVLHDFATSFIRRNLIDRQE